MSTLDSPDLSMEDAIYEILLVNFQSWNPPNLFHPTTLTIHNHLLGRQLLQRDSHDCNQCSLP